MAKISVIVPVYNAEKYLGKCLESLLNQTQTDIEIILIDDASTDKSLDIMASYQEKSPRTIKIIQNKTNSGVAFSRNKGLEIATGDYIGFVDSDDYITPNMYEDMLRSCEETSSQLARTNRKIVTGKLDLSFLGRNCSYEEPSIINPREDKRYLITDPPCATNKLFRRDLIGEAKFPEGLKWEDYPFTVPLMVKANQVVNVPGKNYAYRMHPNSTTCRDARKLNPNLLDIFTGSDIITQACLTEDLNENTRYLINYLQMENCAGRLKEIFNANIPLHEKRELLTLVSKLINVKYGSWQTHELHQEQKAKNPVHRLRITAVESILLPEENFPIEETEIKQKIKVKLDKHTK